MMNATIRRGCRCLPFVWTGIALVGAAEPGPGLTADVVPLVAAAAPAR